jgi:hypothetical protein
MDAEDISRFGLKRTALAACVLLLAAGEIRGEGFPPFQPFAPVQPLEKIAPPKANVTVKTGVETKIGQVFDCDLHVAAPTVSVRAEHGTVVVRQEIGTACGEKNVPVSNIFYKSEPGFSGRETAYVTGFLAGRMGKLEQTILIDVVDPSKPDATATAGQETRIQQLWDCASRERPPAVKVRANRGSVVVRQGSGPVCDGQDTQVNVVLYTAPKNFSGEDKVFLSVVKPAIKKVIRVRVAPAVAD